TLASYSSTASYSVTYLQPNGPAVCAVTFVTGRSSFSWAKNVTFPAATNADQRVTASAPYSKAFTQAALDSLLKNATCPAAACNVTMQPVAAAKTSDPDNAVAFAFWPANRSVFASTGRTDLLTPLAAALPLGAFKLATGGAGAHTLRVKLTDGAAVLAQNTSAFSVCSDQDADRFCPAPAGASAGGAWDCDDASPTVNPNATELCNGIDDTCDGEIDEAFRTAENNIGSPCGVADSACAGVVVCAADGQGVSCNAPYRPGELEPACGSGEDNDCDGIIDDQQVITTADGRTVPLCSIQCSDGDTKECGSSFGICRNSPGTRTCANGVWGECIGVVQPRGELCNKLDDNCDGIADNIGAPIGDFAPAGGSCGCANGAPPAAEVCDGVDNDCNGAVDDGGVLCCTSGQTRSCGEGACSGIQQCVSGAWESSCQSAQQPSAELCDGLDNDCDGLVDDGCSSAGQPTPPPQNTIRLPLLGELNPLLLVLFGGMAFLAAALLVRWEKKRGRAKRAARTSRAEEAEEESEEEEA
ncbi:MAG TPA: putative metal-binding motif-containing protein, partial [archaeon]|nr:putative metal-binding motif-containing protein [archaeon]